MSAPAEDDVVTLDYATLAELRGDGEGPMDHPCPVCGPERESEDRRMRPVFRTWDLDHGGISYNCVRCGVRGGVSADPLQLVQARLRPRKPQPKPRAKVSLQRVEGLWNEATVDLPTEAVAYFARRGIPLDDVPKGVLRFHPKCPWEGEKLPCILARFTDALTGEPKGIWRRCFEFKPMTLGPMSGCAIRLWPTIGKRLVIGEGVETTLAAATRITHRVDSSSPGVGDGVRQ